MIVVIMNSIRPKLRDQKIAAEKVIAWLSGAAAAAFFAVTLLVVNAVQILSLIVRPFSENGFRRINCAIAGFWWSWLIVWMKWVRGIKFEISGDILPPRETVLLIANHQQMPDILALMPLASRHGRLGDLKWFVKDVLKYVPGIGWGMRFIDTVFLKRDWNRDQARIEVTFQRLRRAGVPFWLVIFAEGTRMRPAKLARSQQYSREHGIRELRHVLLPRPKGFAACIHGLGDRIDAVYDVTIAYRGGIHGLWGYFQGKTRRVSLHVRRFPAGAVPRDDQAIASWLFKRFEEKDDLLDRFAKSGSF